MVSARRAREERVTVREEREHDDAHPAVQAAPRREKARRRESQRDAYKICPQQNTPEPPRLVRDAAEDEAAEEARGRLVESALASNHADLCRVEDSRLAEQPRRAA